MKIKSFKVIEILKDTRPDQAFVHACLQMELSEYETYQILMEHPEFLDSITFEMIHDGNIKISRYWLSQLMCNRSNVFHRNSILTSNLLNFSLYHEHLYVVLSKVPEYFMYIKDYQATNEKLGAHLTYCLAKQDKVFRSLLRYERDRHYEKIFFPNIVKQLPRPEFCDIHKKNPVKLIGGQLVCEICRRQDMLRSEANKYGVNTNDVVNELESNDSEYAKKTFIDLITENMIVNGEENNLDILETWHESDGNPVNLALLLLKDALDKENKRNPLVIKEMSYTVDMIRAIEKAFNIPPAEYNKFFCANIDMDKIRSLVIENMVEDGYTRSCAEENINSAKLVIDGSFLTVTYPSELTDTYEVIDENTLKFIR